MVLLITLCGVVVAPPSLVAGDETASRPPMLTELAELTAAGGAAGDALGAAVATHGELAVVGAPGHPDGGTSGAVYVFLRNRNGADAWGQRVVLSAGDGETGDALGAAVATNGDLVVAGTPGDDDQGADAGAVYLFARNEGGADTWGQVAKLTADDAAAGQELGSAVAIEGSLVVVGAPGDNGRAGAVYLFERNEGGADLWGQVAKLSAADGAEGDELGQAVGIHRSFVVAGAPFASTVSGESGTAYVFARNEGGGDLWGQVAKLVADDAAGGDRLGGAVAIRDGRAVAGAPGANAGATDAGAAYLFERNYLGVADGWGQVAKLVADDAAEGDELGSAVTLGHADAVVTAPFAENGAGVAYRFARNANGSDRWGQVARLTAAEGAPGNHLGTAAAMAHGTLLLGAPSRSPAGAVHLFVSGGAVWVELAKAVGTDSATYDELGAAVAISGEVVLAGAEKDDDGCTSNPSCESGSAYLFARNRGGGDLWGQVTKVVAADDDSQDRFGGSVALAGPVAISGAALDSEVAPGAGAAYILERNRGGADGWGQVTKLVAADGGQLDSFGRAVAVDGGRALVGSTNDDSGAFCGGAVYLFERNLGGADGWGQAAKLLPGDPQQFTHFGWSVALANDTLVAAKPGGTSCPPDCTTGAAYVFERNQGGADAWGQLRKLVPLDGAFDDYFGRALAIDGDILVVGAPRHDAAGTDSGAAYVFLRNAGAADGWGQVAKLTAADGAAGDYFGDGVAVDGDRVVVGAWADDDAGNASGSAYLFARNEGGADGWGQVTKLTAAEAAADDYFGMGVAIDGDTVAIGARAADGWTGAVFIFQATAPPEADLSITKGGDQGTVAAGGQLLYTIHVANAGPGDAEQVVVNDLLPAGVTLISTSGCAEDPAAVPTCSLGTVAAGDNAEYTVEVAVDASLTGQLVNEATVSADTPDGNPGDETATAVTAVEAVADLTVSIASDPLQYLPEAALSYTISITNLGPSSAPATEVDAVFPPQLEGIVWACAAAGGASCALAGTGNIADECDLPPGTTVTYAATGTVATGTTGALSSTATATPAPTVTDPQGDSNSATALTSEAPFFADGFESGDTTMWSVTAP